MDSSTVNLYILLLPDLLIFGALKKSNSDQGKKEDRRVVVGEVNGLDIDFRLSRNCSVYPCDAYV